LTVRSVNGPQFTVIEGAWGPETNHCGYGAARCVFLTDGASLSGFTLRHGGTHIFENYGLDYYWDRGGGGVWCAGTDAQVIDCIVTANSADLYGGGALGGTFVNCTFTYNDAAIGGGANHSTLKHCTLTNNSAVMGGAVTDCNLENCVAQT
jgi:hypothetical protein